MKHKNSFQTFDLEIIRQKLPKMCLYVSVEDFFLTCFIKK